MVKFTSTLAIIVGLAMQPNAIAASPQRIHAGLSPSPASPAREEIVPLVDHHQHLVSPSVLEAINRALLARIDVPPAIARVLAQRAEFTKDPARLTPLFTEDALFLVGEPQAGWIRGGRAAAERISKFSGPGYRLKPVSYTLDGNSAEVLGYITRGEGATLLHRGYFSIQLRKDAGGVWRIASETPVFPGPSPERVIDAQRLVQMLDAAGIRRAAVLSTAYFFGSKNMDLYRGQRTVEELHRLTSAENDWTARQVALYPDRLVALCSFNPLDSFALTELDRCASSGRFRGLKLHLDESGLDLGNQEHVAKLARVFAGANRHRMAIVVHVGNNSLGEGAAPENRVRVETLLNMIAAEAPDIPVQIAHLWGGGGFSEEALAAYAEAVASGAPGTKNLYFDVAEATLIASHYGPRKAEILAMSAKRIRQIGLNRVFYGSDGALAGHLAPADAWAQFRSEVPLTDAELLTIANNVAPYLK